MFSNFHVAAQKRPSPYEMRELEQELPQGLQNKQVKKEDKQPFNMFQEDSDEDLIFTQVLRSQPKKPQPPRGPVEKAEKSVSTEPDQTRSFQIDYFYVLADKISNDSGLDKFIRIDRLNDKIPYRFVSKVYYGPTTTEFGDINIDMPYKIINHVYTIMDGNNKTILFELQWFPRNKDQHLAPAFFDSLQLAQCYPRILLDYIRKQGVLFVKNS